MDVAPAQLGTARPKERTKLVLISDFAAHRLPTFSPRHRWF